MDFPHGIWKIAIQTGFYLKVGDVSDNPYNKMFKLKVLTDHDYKNESQVLCDLSLSNRYLAFLLLVTNVHSVNYVN